MMEAFMVGMKALNRHVWKFIIDGVESTRRLDGGFVLCCYADLCGYGTHSILHSKTDS